MTQPDRCPDCGAERSAGDLPPLPDPPGDRRSRDRPPVVPGGRPAGRRRDDRPRRPGHDRRLHRPGPPRPAPRHRPRRGARADRPPARDGDDDRSIRYQIVGEIARGGMGAVLKGRDPDLGRDLAIKVLLEKCQRQCRDGPALRRGGADRRPAPAPGHRPGLRAGDLRRPPPLLHDEAGQGPDPGRSCSASATAPGDDLPRFLSIFEAVCQTVAYAHARGVIHRDLKPSNIMVGSIRRGAGDGLGPGQGAAPRRGRGRRRRRRGRGPETSSPRRAAAPTRGLSRTPAGVGTPAYMAPEQARGEVEMSRRAGRRLRAGLDPVRGPHRQAGVHRADLGEILRKAAPRRHGRRLRPGWTAAGPTPS